MPAIFPMTPPEVSSRRRVPWVRNERKRKFSNVSPFRYFLWNGNNKLGLQLLFESILHILAFLFFVFQAAPATASCATALRTRTYQKTRHLAHATAPTARPGATPPTRHEIRPSWPPQPLIRAPYLRCRAN